MSASVVPGERETLHLERRRNLAVTVEACGRWSTFSCRFEGGCTRDVDGGAHRFSGLPPGGWESRLRAPEPAPESAVEIAEALTTFARRCGAAPRLRYSAVAMSRVTVGTALDTTPRRDRVWALTGELTTPRGWRMPVGWSGRGCGLARLRDERTAVEYAALMRAGERAQPMGAGSGPAVLGRSAAALVLHEAVGHFAEASAGADLRHRLSTQIASDRVSVYDDPLAPDGHASYEVDDEGIAALESTEVVRQGVLVGQLHSLASARSAGAVPTANGRAHCAWAPPIPRLSNLVCAPGRASDEELIDHVGNGLLIHRLADGWSRGLEIGATIVLAEVVRGGRRTGRFLAHGRLRERPDVLTRAVELGSAAAFAANGMCGKAGQVLYDVGTCAPAMRLSELNVER